jgi:nitrogen regulatory protein P-II 1
MQATPWKRVFAAWRAERKTHGPTKKERGRSMKICKVECIIKPFKLEEVKEALVQLGVTGLTIYEVQGFGRTRGHREIYRGAEYKVDFVHKIKIELFIVAERAEEAVQVILKAARTGDVGDGKIIVIAIDSITRIRTGEKDIDAL